MVPITPRAFFAGEAFCSTSFFATVDALLSLDSLMPLILRRLLAAAALVGLLADVVPGFLPLAGPEFKLMFVALAFFLGDRAFSAQPPNRLDTLPCLVGDFEGPGAFSFAK